MFLLRPTCSVSAPADVLCFCSCSRRPALLLLRLPCSASAPAELLSFCSREQKLLKEKELREGLQLYKSGKYEAALEKFESVLRSRPEYNEADVASYNVVCCYSKLDQVQAGLSALEDALKDGFEDFKRIRTDLTWKI